jgi:hypothetical protein
MHVSGEDGVWGRVIRGSIWWFVRVHAVLGRGKRLTGKVSNKGVGVGDTGSVNSDASCLSFSSII